MTDHPPAIPAIQVRRSVWVPLPTPPDYAYVSHATTGGSLVEHITPLGLSPEQPARLSGEP